jgi:thiamine transport system substrate-binding protein
MPMFKRATISGLWLAGLLALAACGGETATTQGSPAPATQPAGQTTGQTAQFAGQTLTLVTHDSFVVSSEVISGFQELTGAKVQILESGDAGAALNKSILAAGAPLGDVQFGTDNTFLSRALEADIFEPYAPKNLDRVPADLKLDPENRLVPIDFGYVNLNYDKAALAAAKLQPPADLRELTKPEWKGTLVVENPATSSPGLAFLLATIDHFGESGDYTWRDFWRDLRTNEVKVTAGWEDAYYSEFAGGGSGGTYPLVVSYATSPAAAVIFSTTPLTDAPTGNLLPPGGAFRQIEFAGILRGTKNPELARAWMDYMLSEPFQNDVAGQMFVYPALSGASVPAEFEKYAAVPTTTSKLTPEQVAQNREKWITDWTEIVLR